MGFSTCHPKYDALGDWVFPAKGMWGKAGAEDFLGFLWSKPGDSHVRSPPSQRKGICLWCRRRRFSLWVEKIPRRRKWQPTPVLLPGESHGQRSREGYSPWGHRVRNDWATKLPPPTISKDKGAEGQLRGRTDLQDWLHSAHTVIPSFHDFLPFTKPSIKTRKLKHFSRSSLHHEGSHVM